jgi:hypothetical protein
MFGDAAIGKAIDVDMLHGESLALRSRCRRRWKTDPPSPVEI